MVKCVYISTEQVNIVFITHHPLNLLYSALLLLNMLVSLNFLNKATLERKFTQLLALALELYPKFALSSLLPFLNHLVVALASFLFLMFSIHNALLHHRR